MTPSLLEILATSLFALAVAHTFACGRFRAYGNRFPEGSVKENVFHLLGEVEVVFGLWAAVFALVVAIWLGHTTMLGYFESLNFTEPLFVFAIMAVAATRPLIELTRWLILSAAKVLPFTRNLNVYVSSLIIGPLLGSFITEPAAMTVTALVLRDFFFSQNLSQRAKYITFGTLLVNVSIGGVLTHFAAPPVLMVARVWSWDTPFMLTHFGWKAATVVALGAMTAALMLKKELVQIQIGKAQAAALSAPKWLLIVHLGFLAAIVFFSHHPIIFIGLIFLFLGIARATKEYQDPLKIREAGLVALFLGGLVVLGGLQSWWLKPLLTSLSEFGLYFGAITLTAITDNAALTYLGSQVDGLGEFSKYALVAGAVVGGGLTVIANAPNPVAFSILEEKFGEDGIHPLRLFLAALIPTVIAGIAFWFLP